jgi:hypothetical protein
MKTFCFTTVIAVFLLCCFNGVQAQNVTQKLDQLKLAKAFFAGTWQHVISKDSLEISETQQYDKAFVSNNYLIVNGKKSLRSTDSYFFSSEEGKFKGFWLWPNGDNVTWIGSFTTEKKFSFILVQDFNPEKIISKVEAILETPANYSATFFTPDGTKAGEYKWTKVK